MGRRRVLLTISALAIVAAVGTFFRGQYIAWQAAQLELAGEHPEAMAIDAAPKRDGWSLEGPTVEFEAAAKRNAARHHSTMAIILAAAGLLAGYWGWRKGGPVPAIVDADREAP